MQTAMMIMILVKETLLQMENGYQQLPVPGSLSPRLSPRCSVCSQVTLQVGAMDRQRTTGTPMSQVVTGVPTPATDQMSGRRIDGIATRVRMDRYQTVGTLTDLMIIVTAIKATIRGDMDHHHRQAVGTPTDKVITRGTTPVNL